MRLALAAALALSLAACATPSTTYGPAAGPGQVGYRSTQIETDRFRVSFIANADLRRPQIEDMALRRAAEIAIENGADWFRVIDRHVDQLGGHRGGGDPHGGVGVASTSGGYRSHTSVGVGMSFDLSPDTRRFEAAMEILLGHGPKPDAPDAYDARSIMSRYASPR